MSEYCQPVDGDLILSAKDFVSLVDQAKKRIERAREMTGGKMEMTLVARDSEELEALRKASKGMRGIKNIDFRLDRGRSIG